MSTEDSKEQNSKINNKGRQYITEQFNSIHVLTTVIEGRSILHVGTIQDSRLQKNTGHYIAFDGSLRCIEPK